MFTNKFRGEITHHTACSRYLNWQFLLPIMVDIDPVMVFATSIATGAVKPKVGQAASQIYDPTR